MRIKFLEMVKEKRERKVIQKLVSERLNRLPAKEQADIAKSLNIIYTCTSSMKAIEASMDAIEMYKDLPETAEWVAYQLTIGTQANDIEAHWLDHSLGAIVECMAGCYTTEPMIELAKRLAEPEHRRRLVFAYLNDIIYLTYDRKRVAALANQLLDIKPELVKEKAAALSAEAWQAKKAKEEGTE